MVVNPNRWSWSGTSRKPRALDDAVTSSQLLITPSLNPDLCEHTPADKKLLQPGAAVASSRRLNNRWSWRPDAGISVTLEDQQENEQEDGGQPATSRDPRRPSKRIKKLDAIAPTKRPRPLSMIAASSPTFASASSQSNILQQQQQQQQQQHQEVGDQLSSRPSRSPPPNQPSTGVKDALSRFLSRKFSRRQMKASRPKEADPTPPPSRHQHEPTSRPIQSSLHNSQNTHRGASPAIPAIPVTHANHAQGRIDNGRMAIAAPLPGHDEQAELQLLPIDVPPNPTHATDAATDSLGHLGHLGSDTTLSSVPPAPSADETGILGRLMRRRLASKDKDAENNKKHSIHAGDDNTSQSAGADHDHQNSHSPDPVNNNDEVTATGLQTQSLLLHTFYASQNKLNEKAKTQDSQSVSEARSPSSSTAPRFFTQVARSQQAAAPSPGPSQAPGTVTLPESKPRSQSHSQIQSQHHMVASTPAAQPKVRTKPSFGKRFWSKSVTNDFVSGDDAGSTNNSKTDTPVVAPLVRPIYVPKHAASDFSRTTQPPRNHLLSSSAENGDDDPRPLATISTQAIEDELQFREQRARALSAEKAEKRKLREMSSSTTKYDAPSPQELHRRLEIVKRSEIEVVTTREPVMLDPWPQQYSLLQNNSNASSANGKGVLRSQSQSRPKSSQRHSFNLVADPYARDLTPPKSVSPVEMEAPLEPPNQPSQPIPEKAPQQATQQALEKPKTYKPTHAAHSSRPRTQAEEKPRKEMTDYERFIADAEAAERDYHAQMWRNLDRRSGHYGYSDKGYATYRPDPISTNPGLLMNTQQSNSRDNTYYSVNKRASVISTAVEDERHLIYGQPVGQPGADAGADIHRLKRQGSISRRISNYIKPSKSSHDASHEDWMAKGRANRKSFITGVAEE